MMVEDHVFNCSVVDVDDLLFDLPLVLLDVLLLTLHQHCVFTTATPALFVAH